MNHSPSELLKNHSRHYLEMALSHHRRQRLDQPDGYGKRTGDCGDTVEIFLEVQADRIARTRFDTDGCLNTNACANTVAQLAEGQPVSRAWEITADDIIAYLESLPAGEHHCAELAVGAFYLALSDYQKYRRSPWKKVYRR
jgi:nitrogen fixation NifU-like protein